MQETFGLSLCNSLTFGRLRADERPGVAEALPPVGPVEGRGVGVEGDAGVAGVPFDAVEDFAAQGFAHAALAQLRAFGIVEFVQLENNNEAWTTLPGPDTSKKVCPTFLERFYFFRSEQLFYFIEFNFLTF